MENNHFSGNFKTLKAYWDNPNRALKFTKGGSRVPAIEFLLDRLEVDIHNGIWLDTAIGAGFVQTKISQEVNPNMIVGLDFSRAMLDQCRNDIGIEKILGSSFAIPFRDQSITVVTNIFSLSDYPDPSKAFVEMTRVTQKTGIVSYMDYAPTDDYWSTRKSNHNMLGSNNQKIVGNIHLRSVSELIPIFPQSLRVVFSTTISYNVDSSMLSANFPLPPEITREFSYVEGYKSR